MKHIILPCVFLSLFLPAAAERPGCSQAPFNTINPCSSEPEQRLQSLAVLTSEFDEYITYMMELWSVKGISVAVVRSGSDPEYGAWGERSEDGQRMTVDTLFNIASCSKAFLSASMGILIDDYANGRNNSPLPEEIKTFNWETKVKHLLLDDWELQDVWASEKANLQDLLSHATGMPRHDASYGPNDSAHDLVRHLRFLRPAHELRQEYAYNNQMFITGSHIISKYTGSYTDFATQRIFQPLGMKSSTFSPTAAAKTGNLSQSWTAHSQRIPFWFTEADKELNAGAGGIITNVVDLSKWLGMLLNSGVNPDTNETVVPASAFQRATTAHIISSGKAASPEKSISGYGMGWGRSSYQGHEMLSHGGAIPGFSSFIAFFPNDDLGIAVLANTGDKGPVVQALLYRVAEIALNLRRIPQAEDPTSPYPKRPTRPENTNTSLLLEAYSGTYTSPGYGSFTLCDPSGSSFYCKEVLSSFSAVDNARSLPLPPSLDIPQLFGAWPRVWSTHIRLAHFENDTFDVVLPAMFPEGYGQSKTAFETYELDQYSGKAAFVVQKGKVIGFGFYGTEPEMKGKKGDGIDVEEGAIAWFRKV